MDQITEPQLFEMIGRMLVTEQMLRMHIQKLTTENQQLKDALAKEQKQDK